MNDLAPHWRWRFTDADGTALDRPVSPTFTAQFDAEEWFGLHWRALRDQGAARAQLREREKAIGAVHDLTVVPERMTFAPVTD
ncbi:hypothetical protein [Cellulomonas sp. NPDC089187]|uniref:hypothetical protein n=1 Tax=Cellulomonas sp. NPDC089187 TaxID=3154970 RepID=UPI0034416F1A